MNPMYYILIVVIVFVVAIDLYLKKKNKKSDSTDIDFPKKKENSSNVLIISIGSFLVILVIGFIVADKYVYEGRLSDSNDNISIIQNLTLKTSSIDDIKIEDTLFVYKSNLLPVTSKIEDSQGNFNGFIINGAKEGFWRFFWNNGNIKAEINFFNGFPKNNLKTNEDTLEITDLSFFLNDSTNFNFDSRGIFQFGRKGKANFWHENSQLAEEKIYKHKSVLNGNSKTYYDNGQVEIDKNYVNGFLSGEYKSWFKNGQIKIECFYDRDFMYGSYKEWFENGNQKSILNYITTERIHNAYNVKNWRKRSVRDGLVQYFHENGNKRIEGVFNEGEPVGLITLWYLNGNTQETRNYLDDPYNEIYFNCTNCWQGVQDGMFKQYSENGDIISAKEYYYDFSLNYNNVYKEYYYSEGSLRQVTTYESGKNYFADDAIDNIRWYEDGKEVQFQEFKNGVPYGKRIFFN